MAIADRVKKVFSEATGASVVALKDEAKLSDFADEFDTVEVIMALESEFTISVEDTEYADLTTVLDLVDLVRSKKISGGGDAYYATVLKGINSQFGVAISKPVAGRFKSFQELVNYIYNTRVAP